MFRVSKTNGTAGARMTERARAQAEGRIGHVRLVEHASQAEAGSRQQCLVLAKAVLTGQFIEQLTFQQAAIE